MQQRIVPQDLSIYIPLTNLEYLGKEKYSMAVQHESASIVLFQGYFFSTEIIWLSAVQTN